MQQPPDLIGAQNSRRLGFQRSDVFLVARGGKSVEGAHERKKEHQRQREGDRCRKGVGGIGRQALGASITAIAVDGVSNLMEDGLGEERPIDPFQLGLEVEDRHDQHVRGANLGPVGKCLDDDRLARNRGVAGSVLDALRDVLGAILGGKCGNAAQAEKNAAVDDDRGGLQRGRPGRLIDVLRCRRRHDPECNRRNKGDEQEAMRHPLHDDDLRSTRTIELPFCRPTVQKRMLAPMIGPDSAISNLNPPFL